MLILRGITLYFVHPPPLCSLFFVGFSMSPGLMKLSGEEVKESGGFSFFGIWWAMVLICVLGKYLENLSIMNGLHWICNEDYGRGIWAWQALLWAHLLVAFAWEAYFGISYFVGVTGGRAPPLCALATRPANGPKYSRLLSLCVGGLGLAVWVATFRVLVWAIRQALISTFERHRGRNSCPGFTVAPHQNIYLGASP